MSMYCWSCGKEVSETAAFCGHCGKAQHPRNVEASEHDDNRDKRPDLTTPPESPTDVGPAEASELQAATAATGAGIGSPVQPPTRAIEPAHDASGPIIAPSPEPAPPVSTIAGAMLVTIAAVFPWAPNFPTLSPLEIRLGRLIGLYGPDALGDIPSGVVLVLIGVLALLLHRRRVLMWIFGAAALAAPAVLLFTLGELSTYSSPELARAATGLACCFIGGILIAVPRRETGRDPAKSPPG